MSRRLPIYFLIDISESMVGEPIQQVEEGLSTIIQALKTDPVAMETVYVSIIVFAGEAKTLIPLQEIINFYPPKFPIGSGTSLSKGLGHLMYELRRNIIKTTPEQKGDWKPIVFLFTDGVPTDETNNAIIEWKKNWQGSSNMVAVSFGDETDSKLLGKLTENVLLFKNTNASSYKEFFKWVTASIKTSSVSVENNSSGFELAALDNTVIEKIDLSKEKPKQWVDNNFVVLSAKCQNTKRPYLMKYRKQLDHSEYGDFGISTMHYRLVGAYQIDNSYFELSDQNAISQKINTEELRGAPTCPCCGNQFAFAVCSCGNLHCIGDEEISTCPWCNTTAKYGFGGDGGFDVNRTQG
ncbi:TerY-C metal binding domain-containing protein [Myroides marinus]|uniref:TerY-C metal binding domain-containing protein n=1 Tax=Myroides marinus TaxID=703342 RepID=UPI002578BE83|nr:TerY-C metal binding domain-containing protein [Myroides marinus]MDM1371679.1 VWA domain-containing protein [Myroides marinus]